MNRMETLLYSTILFNRNNHDISNNPNSLCSLREKTIFKHHMTTQHTTAKSTQTTVRSRISDQQKTNTKSYLCARVAGFNKRNRETGAYIGGPSSHQYRTCNAWRFIQSLQHLSTCGCSEQLLWQHIHLFHNLSIPKHARISCCIRIIAKRAGRRRQQVAENPNLLPFCLRFYLHGNKISIRQTII
jgi:hypothetical protein